MFKRLCSWLKNKIEQHRKLLFIIFIVLLLPTLAVLRLETDPLTVKLDIIWSGIRNSTVILLYFILIYRLPIMSRFRVLSQIVIRIFITMSIISLILSYYYFWKIIIFSIEELINIHLYLYAIFFSLSLFLGNYVNLRKGILQKNRVI